MAVANAHSLGARPFGREDYIRKFQTMTDGLITPREANRFLADVQDLATIPAGGLSVLNVAVPPLIVIVGAPVFRSATDVPTE